MTLFYKRFFYIVSATLIFSSLGMAAKPDDESNPPPPLSSIYYHKKEIVDARFGEEQRRAILKQVHQLRVRLSRRVVGQERLGKALEDRLIQYLDHFGSREDEPIALHMIGLPGIGKSVSLKILEDTGIPVFRVDAQSFAGMGALDQLDNMASNLQWWLEEHKKTGTPLIFLVDELDKIPEIAFVDGRVEENTNPLIGFLNGILTDGKISRPRNPKQTIDLSNVMVVTAMNFSPAEIENFSKDVLGKKKSFYDFTIADFERFDQWIRNTPSARPKVLAHLFRANTVSRISPNTVIVKPLSKQNYRQIIKNNIAKTIRMTTSGVSENKYLSVGYSTQFLDFLEQNVVYAPSGARETVVKTNGLTEQLISFGAKLQGPSDISLAQPREIYLDFDKPLGKVVIRVTPLNLKQNEIQRGDTFSQTIEYDLDSRSFLRPQSIALDPPKLRNAPPTEEKEERFYRNAIIAARFPKSSSTLKGVAQQIDEHLIGQEVYSQLMEDELRAFLNRPGPVAKNPPFRVIAGFPGIGKSELVNLSAHFSGIPIARINMQAFSANDSDTLVDFIMTLEEVVRTARQKIKSGKFILLLEELDKVFEINPQTGAFVDRPVMNYIKDLLNDGFIKVTYGKNGSRTTETIDVRNAYNIVTMNFAVDRFGFVADPRLTTIDDVIKAWRSLSSRPIELKKVLGSLFLPETVSRILPRFLIMKPLKKEDYEKIIELQADTILWNRLHDKHGKNQGQIEVKLTPDYKRYLYSESVIPSEGARNVVLVTQHRLATHLEDAIKSIPKSSVLAGEPLQITLDFKPKTSTLIVSARPFRDLNAPRVVLTRSHIELTFPPLEIKGRIPARRIYTSIHEFGHAIVGTMLGKRFDYTAVVSPENGKGGYVRFKNNSNTAKSMIASVYLGLASRAMERIFMSEDPLSASSVLDITSGASNDILKVTQTLWELLYELGMDPLGGVIERKGADADRYAAFADLPAGEVERLGLILREMEDYIIKELLKTHSKKWYIEKITALARAGGMDEKQFYKLIGYVHPGESEANFGETNSIFKDFEKVVVEEPKKVQKARAFKQGLSGQTAAEKLNAASAFFEEVTKKLLHSPKTTSNGSLGGTGCGPKMGNLANPGNQSPPES